MLVLKQLFTFIKLRYSIRKNQLLVSDTRWQHGSPICFAAFIYRKIAKLPITQQPLKLRKKYEHIKYPKNFRSLKINPILHY
jgi:hypothetical protein